MENEKILKGIAASSGIIIGKVFLLEEDEYFIPVKRISKDKIQAEFARLEKAMAVTEKEISENKEALSKMLGESYAEIAVAHLLILKDPMIQQEVSAIINSGFNAEYAIYQMVEKMSKTFDEIEDEYFKERKNDLADIAKKLITNLLGKKDNKLKNLEPGSVIVAKTLTPADTITMKNEMVKAFVTDTGGKTSHTALIAQSLEIPAVVGLKNASSQVYHGMPIIVDGNKGIIILEPSKKTKQEYKKEYEIQITARKELEQFKDLTATTIDGKNITLDANIETPDEINSVLANGASGIGLYRSEFMYMSTKSMPTEEDHFQNYVKIAKQMGEKAVIIRTIDLGGDKLTKLGLMNIGREENPFMGLRAIRLCLKYPEILKTQLKGILRASMYGNLKIMYPMISKIEEIRQANVILQQAKQELKKEGLKFNENIKVGAMIEVPSIAVISDLVAKEVDFMSIGTNDLIQYTIAVDRVNEDVASLYEPLHPAVLRLIKTIIDAGHAAGKPVGMCGEMASSIEYTKVLIGLGLDEFSMSSGKIPKLKKEIRNISFEKSKILAEKLLNCASKDEVFETIQKFND